MKGCGTTLKVQNYKLDEKGLNHFFGPLEARIMEIIWRHPRITIKEVKEKLDEESPINFNTVMTVMNRLVDKRHLQKGKLGRSYVYEPIESKQAFIESQTKAISENLIQEFGDVLVSHLLENLDNFDPDMIKKLEAKINQLKNQGS